MKTINSLLVLMTFLAISIAIQSCESSKKQDQHKASIINANDQFFNKGRLDFADKVFAADYKGGGPARIKEFISARRAAFPDLQVEIQPMIAEGDMVAWLRTNTGTQTGDYMGYKAASKKITWKEMIFTRYNAEGKIAEEWAVSDMKEMLSASSGIDGLYEYMPPLRGQGINRNGRFLYLFGPADGKGPMISQAGTQTMSGNIIKNTIAFCTDPKQIGTSYTWMLKSFSGDTITYDMMDENAQVIATGKAVRISN